MLRPSNPPDLFDALATDRLPRGDRTDAGATLDWRAAVRMMLVFACCTTGFTLAGAPLAVAVPVSAGLAWLVNWLGFRFATLVGEIFARFVLPTGETTPYEHQFSREDALAAQGDIAGALASFEAAIATTPPTTPTGISARIRAAELYMGKSGDPHRAAALFREVQRLPGLPASQDVYVSNRLIDLLLGPLKQPARALVELRRIADRYPNSTTAAHTRTAIATIKRRLSESDGPGAD